MINVALMCWRVQLNLLSFFFRFSFGKSNLRILKHNKAGDKEAHSALWASPILGSLIICPGAGLVHG